MNFATLKEKENTNISEKYTHFKNRGTILIITEAAFHRCSEKICSEKLPNL